MKQDTGLIALVAAAKMFEISTDYNQLLRVYGEAGEKFVDELNLVRAARAHGFKAGLRYITVNELEAITLPALLQLENGQYCLLISRDDGIFQIFDPLYPELLKIRKAQLEKRFSGKAVLLSKNISYACGGKKNSYGLKRMLPVIWKHRQQFYRVLLLSFIVQILGLISPLFSKEIIDNVLVHHSLSTLNVLLGGMLITVVFICTFDTLKTYVFAHAAVRIDALLSTDIFSHVVRIPMKTLNKWQAGDIVSRMGELTNIRQFITGTSVTLVLDFVFALVYLVILFYYSWQLTLITLAAVILYLVFGFAITPLFKYYLREKFQKGADNQSFIIETAAGIQTVKAAAVSNRFIEKRDNLLADFVKTSYKAANIAVFSQSLGTFIYQLFSIAVLFTGTLLIMDNKFTIGTLVAVQMLAGQVMQPLLRIASVWQSFQQTRVSIERVGDIVECKAEPSFNPNRATLPKIQGRISFEHIRFAYKNDGSEILKNINLQINAGEKVGVVGRSGSGKSTLVKLLQRLYIPDSGRVLVDGVDLAQVDTGWLRRQLGVVLQENTLFGGTIAENIALSNTKAGREQIVEAAMLAGAHEFISEMPEGYDTVLGENGNGVSGGQRQRIVIARALLVKPQIMIFDEATSALDYESEKVIMDNLQRISEKRTMLFIAHRLKTVKNCDRIIVMDRGEIVEQGTWGELLDVKGLFYDMYAAQQRRKREEL